MIMKQAIMNVNASSDTVKASTNMNGNLFLLPKSPNDSMLVNFVIVFKGFQTYCVLPFLVNILYSHLDEMGRFF